jgi:hypothetical protein
MWKPITLKEPAMHEQRQSTINEFGESGGFTITQGEGALTPADPAYDPYEAEKYARAAAIVKIKFCSGGRASDLEITRFEAEVLVEALDTFIASTK